MLSPLFHLCPRCCRRIPGLAGQAGPPMVVAQGWPAGVPARCVHGLQPPPAHHRRRPPAAAGSRAGAGGIPVDGAPRPSAGRWHPRHRQRTHAGQLGPLSEAGDGSDLGRTDRVCSCRACIRAGRAGRWRCAECSGRRQQCSWSGRVADCRCCRWHCQHLHSVGCGAGSSRPGTSPIGWAWRLWRCRRHILVGHSRRTLCR